MVSSRSVRSLCRALVVPVAVAALVVTAGLALAADAVVVSQKNRMFQPVALSLDRGDSIEIVNDDAPLLHHAYVDTPAFSFDSGEQQPGSHTMVRFTVAGTFPVRCAIHPKMHLVVTVK